jgi:hypothetical protein
MTCSILILSHSTSHDNVVLTNFSFCLGMFIVILFPRNLISFFSAVHTLNSDNTTRFRINKLVILCLKMCCVLKYILIFLTVRD